MSTAPGNARELGFLKQAEQLLIDGGRPQAPAGLQA